MAASSFPAFHFAKLHISATGNFDVLSSAADFNRLSTAAAGNKDSKTPVLADLFSMIVQSASKVKDAYGRPGAILGPLSLGVSVKSLVVGYSSEISNTALASTSGCSFKHKGGKGSESVLGNFLATDTHGISLRSGLAKCEERSVGCWRSR